MCTVYEVFRQVHRPPTDFKSRNSVPSLDLPDWAAIRDSITRKASSSFPPPTSAWAGDDNVDDDDDVESLPEQEYMPSEVNGEGGDQRIPSSARTRVEAEADAWESATNYSLDRVSRENAFSLPAFGSSARTRTQWAYPGVPRKSLDRQVSDIRRAIARKSISQGIAFNLPASRTKLSVKNEFCPELYGLFTNKHHECSAWQQRRGGVSPRYLSPGPTLKPAPPPKRFTPDICETARDQLRIGGKSNVHVQPTFLSTDVDNGHVLLPSTGMPEVRMRRQSLKRFSKTSIDLKEDTVSLWQQESKPKKDPVMKVALKWRDNARKKNKDGDEATYLSEKKKADVLAWLDKMRLR